MKFGRTSPRRYPPNIIEDVGSARGTFVGSGTTKIYRYMVTYSLWVGHIRNLVSVGAFLHVVIIVGSKWKEMAIIPREKWGVSWISMIFKRVMEPDTSSDFPP